MISIRSNRGGSTLGSLLAGSAIAVVIAILARPAAAQTQPPAPVAEDKAQLDDIVVTAQKRGVAERAQNVPIAITALTGSDLTRRGAQDLSSLTTSVPNVSFESSGAVKGQANFEIRGFGISSSIPSVEPAVGVFVDGVYQGQTYGVITDLFDLQSVEVLRGPQGTLFGRNTTGGAVSVTTRRPGNTFQINAKMAIESGLNTIAGVSVEGPVAGDTLRAKVTGYVANDGGYFYNRFDGRHIGRGTTWFVRPTLVWDVASNIDTTVILEKGRTTGDGPTSSNSQIFKGSIVNIDYEGLTDIDWRRLTSETNVRVGFGDGVITNVAGWGWLDQAGGIDTDGQPITYFDIKEKLHQTQFSEELRYAGTFGGLKVTLGGYYFTQRYDYIESRDLNLVRDRTNLGGSVQQHSLAAFGQVQLSLTKTFSLIAGGRYSWEKKSAQVAGLSNTAPRCNFAAFTCNFNFPGPPFADDGTTTWTHFSPKVGFQWFPTKGVQFYGSYSQGVRSGGYNIRSTAGGSVSPGPYDQEIQDAFEIGGKSDLFGGKVRFNAAAFYNTIHGLQRDVSTPDPLIGSSQITANVGTARIYGAEAELTILAARGLTLGAHLGYLRGKYSVLTADLNGALPGFGSNLQLVRLPKISYGFSANYSVRLSSGNEFWLGTDFGHVDASAAQDNNTAFLRQRNELNASVGYDIGKVTFSLYAKNLLNRVAWSTASLRSAAQGGGIYTPLTKGRVLGASILLKL